MAENFSWLTESTLEAIHVIPTEEKKLPPLKEFSQKFLAHKKALIVVGLLFTTLLIMKITQKGEVLPQRTEAMAAVLPIPKGQVIEGMLLRPVLISPYSLSKAQKIALLLPEDAEKVMGKVRAKKDIPPHKALFWNDFELIPPTKGSVAIPVPVVTYPEK